MSLFISVSARILPFLHRELHSRCSFLAQRAKNTLLSFTYFF